MSHPALRMQIIGTMQDCRTVTCDNLVELQQFFGFDGVSRTQFKKALGSVQYKHKVLKVTRPSKELRTYEERPYTVQFISDDAAEKALDEAQLELA